jgi:hypothetical protein
MADSIKWQGREGEQADCTPRTYEPPTLTVLGALDELTQGSYFQFSCFN